MYDFVLVGGGPTGLTLATYLPGRIALIERQNVLGGCHRFDPSHTRFVEHGPRVYSGAYVNVRRVLEDIGVSWDDVFVKTSFSPEHIDGKRWYRWLSVKEIAWLTLEYLVFALYDPRHGSRISMKTYCLRKRFSAESLRYIDLVCRFSDGAGADRYSLWEFLSGLDQHIAPFYVPRRPTNALFDAWHAKLLSRGVDVFLGKPVTRISSSSVRIDNRVIQGAKIVLCIPPVYAERLLRTSGLKDPGLKDFAKKTKYEPYWSVSFFGATLDNTKGHTTTPWGILAMQYPFGVISAAATLFDAKSPATGKTIRESGDDDVAKEIRRQLGLSEAVEYAFHTGKYNDQAFVAAAKRGYLPFELPSGIALVGCHNGRSTYNFTSMEAAVQNALVYAGRKPKTTWFLSDYLRWVLLLVCVAILQNRR